jgi:4,5-dihydroxyphthalate decarboxylase
MRALKEGIVRPEASSSPVLTDMAPSPRHWRFLRGREFDVAEGSGSGYIAARDRGLPFRAIPVFPHRRFRHGFILVNTSKGIAKPTDLIGRRVGTKGYLFTAGLWMRGILEQRASSGWWPIRTSRVRSGGRFHWTSCSSPSPRAAGATSSGFDGMAL